MPGIRWSERNCCGRITRAPPTCGRPSSRPTSQQAIEMQSQEVYDRYMKYLNGCADLFREGYTDVAQFTLTKV